MYWRIDVIILFKAMKIKIKNVDFSPKQVFFLALYYGIFIWMPDNVIGGAKYGGICGGCAASGYLRSVQGV